MTEFEKSVEKKLNNLTEIQEETRNKISQLEKDVAISSLRIETLSEEIKTMKDTSKWITRIILGGVAAAVLALVLGDPT